MDVSTSTLLATATLRNLVEKTLEDYLEKLDPEQLTGVYNLVLKEVESALLSTMMRYAEGNQSKAASYLGLARGTLRKKLAEHQVFSEDSAA